MNLSYDNIDQVFYSDGYRLATTLLSKGADSENLNQLSQGIYHSVDSLIDALSARVCREGNPLHCGKGCHWCCSKQIFANPREVIFLAGYIRTTFSREKMDRLIESLRIKHDITSKKSLEEKLSLAHFCPLLAERICSAYPARPMACRIYLSTDVDSCIREFSQPDDPSAFARLLEFPLRAGRMMNEGVAARFRELGLMISELTLEEGLLIALQDPGIANRWVSGENVFPCPAYTGVELKILNSLPQNDQNSA